MNDEIFRVPVSFGDCDPAGIVFYPNILRWCDASFHTLLRRHGGHEHLCRVLDAIGIGVAESTARFLSPLRDGDGLDISTSIAEWGRKTVTVAHSGRVEDRVAFEVREIRCLFTAKESAIVAAELGELRRLLEETGG
jgi:4-hydroxybenzoyl-CoA thioesterase